MVIVAARQEGKRSHEQMEIALSTMNEGNEGHTTALDIQGGALTHCLQLLSLEAVRDIRDVRKKMHWLGMTCTA